MAKPGFTVTIPGHGELRLRHLVSDYTGTLSYRGKLATGDDRLRKLSGSLDIHVLTADTRRTAAEQLRELPVQVHKLKAGNENVQKRDFAAHAFEMVPMIGCC